MQIWASIRAGFTTVMFWSYFVVSNAVWWLGSLVVAAFTLPFDPQRRVLHLYTCLWGYHYVGALPLWNTSWTGREKVPKRATVLVANHQSWGDILVLFGLFKHYKWVSKSIVFRVPFIGWNMTLNRYVALKRGDPESIAVMLDRCRDHLRNGSSVMMFPEGSRSKDGRIRSFKHGAFSLAQELDVPIVPIVIDGSLKALPKHGLVMRTPWALPVEVRVLDPVMLTGDPLPEQIAVIRQLMVAELADMRGITPEEAARG